MKTTDEDLYTFYHGYCEAALADGDLRVILYEVTQAARLLLAAFRGSSTSDGGIIRTTP
jgi:hypothetical protein